MLEGGGQILRNSTALAAILCLPITIHSIRAGEWGKLSPQGDVKVAHGHDLTLNGINTVSDLTLNGINTVRDY